MMYIPVCIFSVIVVDDKSILQLAQSNAGEFLDRLEICIRKNRKNSP